MRQREQIIHNYVNAYNNFDIDGMLIHLDPDILFKNVSEGAINMTLEGLTAFRAQAEKAKSLFSQRYQQIIRFKHDEHQSEIDIDYRATLAVDLSDELKKGSKLELKGKSIFKFSQDKIIAITDVS
ncbi:nuclear transport factor 2 family protein [Pedobacter immunditicola]|uniref:nuclear transport factor 2 family protein n=1 Tax=Pedobacter immunditicola TaxID=3133440 RepID=UPI00309CFC29